MSGTQFYFTLHIAVVATTTGSSRQTILAMNALGSHRVSDRRRRTRKSTVRLVHIIVRGSHKGLRQNQPTDSSRYISIPTAFGLHNATVFAEVSGRPLRYFVTMVWELCEAFDGSDSSWKEVERTFFDELHEFSLANDMQLAYVGVRERKPGHGAHTHILLHLSRAGRNHPRVFPRKLRERLRERLRFKNRRCMHVSFKADESDRFDRLQYILKAVDPHATRYVGFQRENVAQLLGLVRYTDREQGVIHIQRCFTSRNLSIKARAATGWIPIKDAAAFKQILQHPCFAWLRLDHAAKATPDIRALFRDPWYRLERLAALYLRADPEGDEWLTTRIPLNDRFRGRQDK